MERIISTRSAPWTPRAPNASKQDPRTPKSHQKWPPSSKNPWNNSTTCEKNTPYWILFHFKQKNKQQKTTRPTKPTRHTRPHNTPDPPNQLNKARRNARSDWIRRPRLRGARGRVVEHPFKICQTLSKNLSLQQPHAFRPGDPDVIPVYRKVVENRIQNRFQKSLDLSFGFYRFSDPKWRQEEGRNP